MAFFTEMMAEGFTPSTFAIFMSLVAKLSTSTAYVLRRVFFGISLTSDNVGVLLLPLGIGTSSIVGWKTR
jgi:hypothetical protein